jgi:enediyne biosynthesis protein E4
VSRRSPSWLVAGALLALLAGAGCARHPAGLTADGRPPTALSKAGRASRLAERPTDLPHIEAVGGPRSAVDGPRSAIRFTDVAQSAGVTFRHESGRSGRFYLPETMGSGCAFLDYNHDGRLDLFLVNSSRLPGFAGKGPFYPALYRNRGDGTFEDVTKQAGLAVDCYGMGVAVGDYDNDGWPDLYLTALGPNFLFRNNGDGTFTDVTRRAGVEDSRFSTSAAFLDYDRDGRLDLFVCNYCVWNPALNVVIQDANGRKHMAGPRRYKGASSALYRNRGDGTFEDVTRRAGVYSSIGKSLGVLVFDVDDDGWPDLMVANDLEPNLLYRNNGDGTFREIGVEAGVAYSNAGKARAGMGIDSADVANDGREAIVIGNNSTEGLALFQPDPGPRAGHPPEAGGGDGAFTDVAEAAGIFTPSLPFLTFGALFVDLDNDGLKDLFAANGHIDEAIHYWQPNTTFAERPLLFQNVGMGRFQEIGAAAGPALQAPIVARGVAAGDYDADGDLDLLVSVHNGRPMLLRNDTRAGNHWLAVRARGVKSNRSGIGTRVTMEAGGLRQRGWIRSGSSYCSASDLVAWFGLGAAAKADRVTLRWPSGTVQTLTDLPANREILVEEPGARGGAGGGIVHRAAAAGR